MNEAPQMAEFREGESVILFAMGPVDGGLARLAKVACIRDSVAWVDFIPFRLDMAEPWDIPKDRTAPIRHVLKRDTPANRRAHGIG